MSKDLVSIIMQSKDNGRYVEETVRSVLAQTYQNWEIIFMDNSSKDNAISQMTDLINESKIQKSDGTIENRIKVSLSVQTKDMGASLNTALREARGKWIAFLNVGDIWLPNKLEKQIAFMEDNGYAFSYTKFGVIDKLSLDRGVIIGGKEHVNYKDMQKCCWPCYLTVVYDADKLGKMHIGNLRHNNSEYALWLNVCEKTDCHLLPENLAKLRTKWGLFGELLLSKKISRIYECFRIEEDMNPFMACLFTIRYGFYGLVKWFKYVERK